MIDWKQEIRCRLAKLKLEPTHEAEIVEELAQHLEDRYAELRARGATEKEASRAALVELSENELLASELRRVERQAKRDPEVFGARRSHMFADLLQDLRYGLRMLRKSPSFTAVAVLSLALGIGANTAIFQLLDAVRLRTLPVKEPQNLAGIRIADMTGARGNFSSPHPTVTNPIWEKIRDNQQAFSGVFAWGTDAFNLTTGGEARYAQALSVSGDFFNVLGIRPILGRVFAPGDDQRGCGSPGTVVSYAFWQSEFGGDRSIVGKTLTLAGRPFEIIGVTPASFFGLEIGRSFDVAVPICSEAMIQGENSRLDSGVTWWLTVMGRIKPGWSPEQATTQLSSASAGIFEATLPSNYPAESVEKYIEFKLETFPAGTGLSWLREQYESPLWLLLAIAGMVLLIACANLANLMLARASAREREIALRLALGASGSRLIRQLLAESLLLAGIGAALGAFLARALSEFLVSFLSTESSTVFLDLGADWRVLGFTAGLAILTCVLFGLMPALRTIRVDPGSAMKAGSRGMTASRERFGLRRALVVTQVALSLVLVVCGVLFSRSLGKLLTVDAGFRQDAMLITNIDLRRLSIPADGRQAFKRELLNRVRETAGVSSAASTNVVPLSGNAWGNNLWMDGSDSGQRTNSFLSRISPDYFKTLGTSLLAGRDFDDRDTITSPKVAIVNETFARTVVEGANPVGKRFWVEATPSAPETLYEIVGLVRDSKYQDLREEFSPVVFLPLSQASRHGEYDQILTRANAPLPALISSMKHTLADINPEILVTFQVLKTEIERSLLRERLMATLSGFFGLLALLLACIGLYGIMSYGVAGRTNEIGIRIALGAKRGDVLWLILREALVLVLIGVASGLPVVLASTKMISSLLYGVKPADPVSICFAALLMFIVAAVAGYVPARRATRIDPLVALRYE